jgi:nucleotide-binding universal stress UspA family protein
VPVRATLGLDPAEEVAVPTQKTGRVVVGISDTLAGYQALRYAVAQARERDLPLVAVRAYTCAAGAPWRDVIVDLAKDYVMKVFAEALGGFPAGVATEVAVGTGEPGRVLVATARRDGDLLVIGGSGARRWTGRRRACVARFCSRWASCPVVIVPPPAMARRARGRMTRDVVLEADLLLTSPWAPPATLPPSN